MDADTISIFYVPCKIAENGRRIVLRLSGYIDMWQVVVTAKTGL